jgi:hypothetical protein
LHSAVGVFHYAKKLQKALMGSVWLASLCGPGPYFIRTGDPSVLGVAWIMSYLRWGLAYVRITFKFSRVSCVVWLDQTPL